MTSSNTLNTHDRLKLRINRELRFVLDDIILKIQKLANQFKIEEKDKKSPFKNVLSVATESSTSLEALKTFIRYQIGRQGSSKIWKEKQNDKFFAVALVEDIDSLAENTSDLIDRIKKSLCSNDDLYKLLDDQNELKQISSELHLMLTQLYLGYLAREHTAKVGEKQSTKNGRK